MSRRSTSCDSERPLFCAARSIAARVSAVIRVVSVADLPLNSPRGFRPAPGARFFANRLPLFVCTILRIVSKIVSKCCDKCKPSAILRHRTTSGTFR